MSISVPASQQRQALDLNQKQIARTLLPALGNLEAFNNYIVTFSDEELAAEPYLYDPDEIYALRRFGETGAAYAAIFGAGGTMSAADGAVLAELTRQSAGAPVFVNQGS
jgi:hypothetical protein